MNAIILPQEQFDALVADVQIIKDRLLMSGRQSNLDDLITEEQLSEKLGNPHASTIWRHEKSGRLNVIKVGNKKLYKLSEVISLNSKKVK